MCLVALSCEQLSPIREWRWEDIDEVLLCVIIFLSAFGSS